MSTLIDTFVLFTINKDLALLFKYLNLELHFLFSVTLFLAHFFFKHELELTTIWFGLINIVNVSK